MLKGRENGYDARKKRNEKLKYMWKKRKSWIVEKREGTPMPRVILLFIHDFRVSLPQFSSRLYVYINGVRIYGASYSNLT